MRKLFWIPTTIAILALVGIGVACEDDPSEEEARAALCADLEQLETAVDNFLQLNAQSTIGEIRAARDDVGDAMDDVQSSADDVSDAETAELEQAYDDFNETVDTIEDDQTAQEALDMVRASAENVVATEQQLFTDSRLRWRGAGRTARRTADRACSNGTSRRAADRHSRAGGHRCAY